MATLTPIEGDPFAAQAAPVPPTTAPRLTPVEGNPFQAPGLLESLARGAAEGATLGFGDEIGLLSRERQEASRRSNPWTHFIGEMLGTIAPAMVATPVAAGRLGTSLAARGARAVARPFAAADMSTLPRSIGQGAKLGASYGAVSGAGHADTPADASWGQALAQRAGGALTGGAVGGALGGPAGALTYPIARAAQALGGARAAARAETENAGAGAMTALSRSLERDRITPSDLVAQIRTELPDDTAAAGIANRFFGSAAVPTAQRGVVTAEMAEEISRRSLAGESVADIVAAMQRGGSGPGETVVRSMLEELAERHTVPVNLVDRSKLIRAGSGENMGWTLRAASATPGEARAVARERLVERQIGQGQRVSDAITRHIGTPDFETRSAQLAREMADRNTALFDAAREADVLTTTLAGRTIGDAIQPVLDAHAMQWAYQRGPVATAIGRAIEAFRPQARPGDAARRLGTAADRPLGTLDEFMQAKQNLQALFDESQTNRTVMRALTRFKDDLYDAVSAHNPQWRVANDAAADGFAAQRALNLGMEYAGRLGPQTREQLARYRNMAPPEQELYRVGVAQRLHERIMNRQDTHDLTSELRLPGVRDTLRTILGDREANAFFRRIDREFATTRTYREQFGSQTTPLREAIDELSWAPQFQSVWDLMSPSKIAEQAAVWAARNMNETRNQQLLNMLTTTDPVQQLNLLRALGPLHQARSQAGRRVGVPTVGALGAGVPNALAGALADLQRQQSRSAR